MLFSKSDEEKELTFPGGLFCTRYVLGALIHYLRNVTALESNDESTVLESKLYQESQRKSYLFNSDFISQVIN